MTSEDFNRHFIEVKDTAFRYAVSLLRDRHAAEDAAQDLYEKLWRRRLLILAGGRFRSLAMTSMRNICLDRLRSRRRNPVSADLAAAERLPSVQEDGVAGEASAIVAALVARLPDREREVMHLRDVEGMEIDRIAALTASSEASVRMALSRARNRVKEEYIKIMSHGL